MKITNDTSILSIIREGYKIEFEERPFQIGTPNNYKFTSGEQDLITQEINKLAKFHVIEPVESSQDQYISPIFALEKKDHSSRMILNLKKLNELVKYKKFKMDTFTSVLPLVRENCYMASIDMKLAYYTIPINEEYRKYLRFSWNNQIFQYTCLPNGLSSAPRIFTKLMKPIFANLRRSGHINLSYIDDIYLQSDSYDECLQNVHETKKMLQELGFTINMNKSVFTPSKSLQFLGFIVDSENMSVHLSKDKIKIVIQKCTRMLNLSVSSLRELASLIGTLISVFPAVEFGPLYYRELERQKIEGLRQNYGNFEASTNITEMMRSQIRWWIENIESSCKLINHKKPTIVLFTDASSHGWGGHLNCEYGKPIVASGVWSDSEATLHSNALELLAIHYSLKKLCASDNNVHIRIMSDNTTAIAYINNMGGIRSQICESIAKMIWDQARCQGNWISAAHVPGVENVLADQLSRKYDDEAEWKLNPNVFQMITNRWGLPDVDMFASRFNKQIMKYVAWKPDSTALYIDAFMCDWQYIYAYIFPPFSQILKVLKKIQIDHSEALLVTPIWPTQVWFTIIMTLLVDYPRVLPTSASLLTLPLSSRVHPLHQKLTLMACRLSGNRSKVKIFQDGLPTLSCHHGVPALKNSIQLMSENGFCTVNKGKLITFMLI